MSLKTVDDTNFQSEVLESEEIVVVKVMTTWCGPCKLYGEVVEGLSENEDLFTNMKFVEMDAEEAVETCPQFAIRGVPTTLVFKDGKLANKPRIGGMQSDHLIAYLIESEQNIAKSQEEESEEKLEEDVDNEE